MEIYNLVPYLIANNLIKNSNATVTPLSGGVSSDIHLVQSDDTAFVVKRALPKLRVKEAWYANISRNHFEQEYMRYVGAILPEAVPNILFSDAGAGLFVMEYLGQGYTVWKSLLLAGQVDLRPGREAGRILGTIHGHSWGDAAARERFNSGQNFFELRIDPYLLATANKHHQLALYLEAEARRLREAAICLVHGDYSPKNILLSLERLVLLDCEVAWYGDPAFDVAFLLNHFLLKALYRAPNSAPYLELAGTFWESYRQALGPQKACAVEEYTARLLPMLLLARVDGKSPVEYLTDPHQKQTVRNFARGIIPQQPKSLRAVLHTWQAQLQ